MQNKKTKYNKSQNESLQNSESSPEFLEKRPAPQGQIPSPPTPRAPPRWESSSFAVDGVGEDKRAGAPPLESKSRCKGELRLPGLVVGHLLWVLLPESSYWPHSDVCPLSEFIFRIHPCHRIKVWDSDSFICFSPLRLEKYSCHCHTEVFKGCYFHSSTMFIQNVFPQRLVSSFPLDISNVKFTSWKAVFSSFAGIFTTDCLFTQVAGDFVPDSCFSANSLLPCVAGEAHLTSAVFLAAGTWHRSAK